ERAHRRARGCLRRPRARRPRATRAAAIRDARRGVRARLRARGRRANRVEPRTLQHGRTSRLRDAGPAAARRIPRTVRVIQRAREGVTIMMQNLTLKDLVDALSGARETA